MSTHTMETRSAAVLSQAEAEKYVAAIATDLKELCPDSVLPEHRCSRCHRLASEHTASNVWNCSDDNCILDEDQYHASLKTQFLGLRRFWEMFDNRKACHTMATSLAIETAALKEEIARSRDLRKKDRKR